MHEGKAYFFCCFARAGEFAESPDRFAYWRGGSESRS